MYIGTGRMLRYDRKLDGVMYSRCDCHVVEVWIVDPENEMEILTFRYGISASDPEHLRSLLESDEEFMARWKAVSKKDRIPSGKWIRARTPPQCYWFRYRGEDSGANSMLTPASYNWDSCVSTVRSINLKRSKNMVLTFDDHFESTLCQYSNICNNFLTNSLQFL